MSIFSPYTGKYGPQKTPYLDTFHVVVVRSEKHKEPVNKGNELGALFCDLAKAFECTDQKLLVVKLFWYRSSPSSLNLIFSYLSNRTLSVKIKTIYSDKSNIECRIPRNSVIGPLLFNIDLIDPFFGCDDS